MASHNSTKASPFGKKMKLVTAAWSLVALILVLGGWLQAYPVRVSQAIGFGLLMAQLLWFWISPKFRAWVLGLQLRHVIIFQCWRVIPGALFLYYYYNLGRLPFDFAVIGGFGDILVGITAFPIAILADADQKRLLRIVLIWQFFALLDLLFVIRTGVLSGFADPEIMRPLTEFPLGLLPTMLVPLTLFAHFVAVIQLRRKMRA